MRTTVTGRFGGRLGRHLWPACLLVFALFLTHQLVMATEQHTMAMGMTRSHAMLARAVAPMAAMVADLPSAAESAGERMPFSGWEECFAQAAILPALLLLLALAGLLRQLATGAPLAGQQTRWLDLHPRPPPLLDPARRRALLQVFRN